MAKRPDRPASKIEEERRWAQQLTAAVGQRVRVWREARDLSASALAARTEDLGYRVEQQVIANMESGRRTSVPVHEVLMLALALDVPPLALLLDIGGEGDVEILPGVFSAPTSIAEWFDGSTPLAQRVTKADGTVRYALNLDATTPMVFDEAALPFRIYDQLPREYQRFREAMSVDDTKEALLVIGTIVRLRADLRRLGLAVPELTGKVAEAVAAQEIGES